jgi:hypothetical protein
MIVRDYQKPLTHCEESRRNDSIWPGFSARGLNMCIQIINGVTIQRLLRPMLVPGFISIVFLGISQMNQFPGIKTEANIGIVFNRSHATEPAGRQFRNLSSGTPVLLQDRFP